MGKIFAGNFYERDVQIFIDVNHGGLELLALGEHGKQGAFIAGNASVGGDDTGLGNKKSAAIFCSPGN